MAVTLIQIRRDTSIAPERRSASKPPKRAELPPTGVLHSCPAPACVSEAGSGTPPSAALFLSVFVTLGCCGHAAAQQPYGWVGNNHAYALPFGAIDLSGSEVRVNDTVDFLSLRDELLAGNSRLTGNSGDLTGSDTELRLGVGLGLELFYREKEQGLTINLGPISSADVENLDNELATEQTAYGAKWVFYDAVNQDPSRAWTSAALELTRTDSSSAEFGGDLAALRTSATGGVLFDPPSRFALDRLADEGWQARLLFTANWSPAATATLWAGFGKNRASSGTRWDVDIAFLRDAFYQTFDSRESQYTLGASLNWHAMPRLPVQLGYEYLAVRDRELDIVRGNGNFTRFIPSFLRGDTLNERTADNHTLFGSVTWWITPSVYASAGATLFSAQFTGVIPHFNNPLSAGLSDVPYGYAEITLGFRFSGIDSH